MYKNIVPASFLFALLGATPAHADWVAYKFLDAAVTGTDNLQLGSGDEVVYSVKPSIELSFKGNRVNADVIAGVELYGFNERGDEIVDPRLELSTSGTVVNNLVYVTSSFDVGKLLPGEDFFDLSEDSETQARFRLNPFISRKFGRFADVYFGYGHQSLDNEADGDVDTQQDTLAFSLGRNPKYGGFIWGFGGNYERDRADNEVFDSLSAYASVGATVGQSVYFEVLGGAEINDYTKNLDDDNEDASVLWEASLNWTPSERTSLRVGYGDRFFGQGPTFSFKHRVRNSTLSATWTRDINNSEVTLNDVSPFTENNSNVVLPTDSEDLINNENDDAILGRALFVDNRLRFGYKLAGRRSDLTIDGIYSDQEELDGDATRERLVGRVAFDRHLSPLTTVRLQYEHLIDERSSNADRQNENRVGLTFIYNFDRKERVSIIKEGDDS